MNDLVLVLLLTCAFLAGWTWRHVPKGYVQVPEWQWISFRKAHDEHQYAK